jgi:hypothetical protein
MGSREPDPPGFSARRPPEDVLPAIVPASRFLVRTDRLIVALSHVGVYPDGCMLEVLGHARGAGSAIDDFFRLVFTVDFGAQRATLYDKTAPQWLPDGRLALQLTSAGGEGGQTGELVDVRLPLWLSPLPPPVTGTLSLVRQEPGAASTGCPLDGWAIVAAAQAAQSYW